MTYDLPPRTDRRGGRPDPDGHHEPAGRPERDQSGAAPRTRHRLAAARRGPGRQGSDPDRRRAGVLCRRRPELDHLVPRRSRRQGREPARGRSDHRGDAPLPAARDRGRQRRRGRPRLQPGRSVRHRADVGGGPPGRPARAASAWWPATAVPRSGRCSRPSCGRGSTLHRGAASRRPPPSRSGSPPASTAPHDLLPEARRWPRGWPPSRPRRCGAPSGWSTCTCLAR